jgi:hypothetical protein
VTQFLTVSYLENSAEKFYLYKIISVLMKFSSSISSSIYYHISIFNAYKTL